ncbi:MAG TPA: CHRD domain-containing protein [Solirubrobacteraceae bacterium]
MRDQTGCRSQRRGAARAAALTFAGLALGACGSGQSAHQVAPVTTATNPKFVPPAAPPTAAEAPPDGTLTVVLTATAALAGGGSSHASLTAKLHFLGSQGKVCWAFTGVAGISGPTSAHISRAIPLVNLPGYNTGPDVEVEFGRAYAPRGCTPITRGVARQILTVPTDHYLAVESENYPNQALRALL